MLPSETSHPCASTCPASDRQSSVMKALDGVMDPELDESVVAMGFVESVNIVDQEVEVSFRLPTFWCSANFAYLMAVDMRYAVERLPFVAKATIRLVDHFASKKINRGVAAGLGFSEAFAGEANTDLTEIRRAFLERAFLGRQEKVVRLCVARWGVATTLGMMMSELEALAHDEDMEMRCAAVRYLAIRRNIKSEAQAFVTFDGQRIEEGAYARHLRSIRRVRGAAEANAEMCRIYLQARISHPISGSNSENRDEIDQHTAEQTLAGKHSA
jgi:metal-sulfur cluster biosynthetic enzyme